jgi:hypothetical protein
LQYKFALDGGLSVIIRSDRCLECLLIFGIFQRANDCLGCKAMTKRVAARGLFSFFRFRSGAFERIAAIGFEPAALITLGNGCVFSQRTRAAAVGFLQSIQQ